MLLNFNEQSQSIDLREKFTNLKSNLIVRIAGASSIYQKNDILLLNEIQLAPFNILILEEKEGVLPFMKSN